MKTFLIILAVIAALIIITAIKASLYKQEKPQVTPMPEERVDEERVQRHLSQAIAIKTISNPDNSKVDWGEFEKFHDFLEKEYPLTHKTLKREKISQAALLYTWQGTNPDLDGIALLSHQDVVPISAGTENDWEHPAFEGYNDGEFIWGRGALDMKNHLICVMEAVETLLEEGYTPERTVYLCFGHNEEIVAGANNGAHDIMKTLKSRGIRLDSTLDEGGAIIPANVKGILQGNLAGVGIAEKGYADFKVTVKAKGGHSSQPPVHTAAGEIADVVKDLENHKFTTACTMLEASPAANVLPQNASVTINFRQLPGTTLKDTEEHIRKVVKNKNIKIELLKGKEASKVSPTDTKAFKTIEKLAHQISNDNIVAPFLVMGGTDSYHYEEITDNLYRFAPFTVDASLMLTTHSTNERIPIAQLKNGVTFFKRYIKEMTK